MIEAAARPLFEAFPALRERVPFVPLASLPTPVQRMERLSAAAGADLWVKRDGLTHPVYGGNKIRKFEFVFGDLLRKGARAVMTGGGLGSHHTLATAVVARQFGLQAICCYYCQPLDEEVFRNLRLSAALDIEAHFCGDYVGLALSFLWQWLRGLARTGRPPYFIYPGAPGRLGVLGYVNAAFELRAQLEAMAEPEPEAIFVAVGSCGTMAGLLLGARLASLNSRIVGVRIIEEDVAHRAKIAKMATGAARYLRRYDPSVPALQIEADEVELLDGYLGDGYAHPTPEARKAVALVAETEHLPLETTYTGKTMAALLDTARRRPGARLLFVDTFAEAPALQGGDYRALPQAFWPIFDPGQQGRCWCLRAWRDPGFCWKQCRDRR
jgi:1-aminocyclopropane-1-carboxylate deaminase/D-cysteine desulfhydrase-like pyridoxal-dependent ACC family enzyme